MTGARFTKTKEDMHDGKKTEIRRWKGRDVGRDKGILR